MNIKRTIITDVLALPLFAISATASADISNYFETDYLVSGDNQITYDAVRDLEWLDLDLTKGMSVLTAEATFTDFRVANFEEMEALKIDFYGNANHNTNVSSYPNDSAFKSIFGDTVDFGIFYYAPLTVGVMGPGGSGRLNFTTLTTNLNWTYAAGGVFMIKDSSSNIGTSGTGGTGTADVNAPLMLGALSMLLIAGARRRA